MKVIDLSHIIDCDTPVYPGSEPVLMQQAATLDTDGYNELLLRFSSHTGTHIDCGRHFIDDGFETGTTLPEKFYGRGVVLDCQHIGAEGIITQDFLKTCEAKIKRADFILFHTGWSRYWGEQSYFTGFPTLNEGAARYLAGFLLKGAGIDTISFDPVHSLFPAHKILLSKGFVLIENLTNLEALPAGGFRFCCLPLKLRHGDGSPVRAVGIV
jgi:arylformamidase